MSYTKHAWVTGETITAEKLNNIEDGVDDVSRQLSDIEENQIPELKNAISEIVLVQDTQPSEEANKLWIPETAEQTFVVPEYSEFEQVADQLIEPSLLLPLVWEKGEAVNHSTGAVDTNSNGAVTDYYETDEARYIVLQLGEGVTTSRYIQFVTYQSDGTYVTGEQIAFATTPYRVRTVKPGYKYRFGVTKPTAANIDDVVAMTEFQYTHLLDSEKGLAGKVADLEAKVPEFEHLKHDVNGGGDQISFVLERGTINTTTGEDSSSNILARSVGYYASVGNGLIITSPVGGTVIPYEYSAEDASGFVSTVGPAGGVTYVNSPYTLPTEAGKYYRFTLNLNNSATWNDPEEFFSGFEFVLANTYQVGLESRVTALEQESGSDKIFTGKVWVALGDSITYRGVDTPQGNPGYRPIVTDILGFTTYNKGIGSTSLGGANDTAAMCSTTRLNGVLHPDSGDSSVTPDFVTILGGANDLGTSMLIGDETEFAKSLEQKNRDTFIGAYSYIIEYLLGQNPTINIMILGTTWAHSDGAGSEYGKTYTEYSNASRKVAEYYGLPFVDLHGECGFNAFTMGATAANRIYSSDQIHPNQAGSEKIASLVAAKMIAAWKYTI